MSPSASLFGLKDLQIGGADRNRTDDLLLAKQALFQLSYDPFTATMTYIISPVTKSFTGKLLCASVGVNRSTNIPEAYVSRFGITP